MTNLFFFVTLRDLRGFVMNKRDESHGPAAAFVRCAPASLAEAKRRREPDTTYCHVTVRLKPDATYYRKNHG